MGVRVNFCQKRNVLFLSLEPNSSFSFPLFLLNVLVEVYVNEDFNNKDLAILVFEKIQMPKQDFALFCTKNSLEKLKKIVDEKVDWTKFNQFNVRLNKSFRNQLFIYLGC